MLSTLLVIGGVLVGLLVLLALIVSLSARPQTTARGQHRARGRTGAVLGRRRRPAAPRRLVAAVDHQHQRDPRRPLTPWPASRRLPRRAAGTVRLCLTATLTRRR